ncbi:hypothetical protein DFS34DRAFT_614373 [Phlyctochytrium arcticum]|nr:hypothetical protein DFS34DRAFT_614373 [Phlyctochytrium arcticum]
MEDHSSYPSNIVVVDTPLFSTSPDPGGGFSSDTHRLFNSIWALHDITVLWWCIRNKRIIPAPLPIHRSKQVDLFITWNIGGRALFYSGELFATDLAWKSPFMAAHHICTLMMFYCMRSEPQFLSTISILPFVMHITHWLLPPEWMTTAMMIYNCLFLVACTIVYFLKSRKLAPVPISNAVPFTGMAVVLCNLGTYWHQ